MVLGQSKDLEAEKNVNSLQLKDIINLQKLKTGALFRWSLRSASILAEENNDHLKNMLKPLDLLFK